MRINIIGAGRLGQTLGKLINLNTTNDIQAICNQSIESSRHAAQLIGAGTPYFKIADLPPAELTFITTPDDKIRAIAQALSESKSFMRPSAVIHCSGALGSNLLESLKNQGCCIASIHPMNSFASPAFSVTQFKGTFCAGEGDAEALSKGFKIFHAIGGEVIHLNTHDKSLYHASGVIASNYLVTLAQQSLECLIHSGLEKKTAMQLLTRLMRGTLNNLEETLSPTDALTGPIKRGDINTVNQQIAALTPLGLEKFYSMMGQFTLKISGLSDEMMTQMNQSFSSKI